MCFRSTATLTVEVTLSWHVSPHVLILLWAWFFSWIVVLLHFVRRRLKSFSGLSQSCQSSWLSALRTTAKDELTTSLCFFTRRTRRSSEYCYQTSNESSLSWSLHLVITDAARLLRNYSFPVFLKKDTRDIVNRSRDRRLSALATLQSHPWWRILSDFQNQSTRQHV